MVRKTTGSLLEDLPRLIHPPQPDQHLGPSREETRVSGAELCCGIEVKQRLLGAILTGEHRPKVVAETGIVGPGGHSAFEDPDGFVALSLHLQGHRHV